LPPLRDTVLIAPACHDTASAIAGIPATGDDWAYISSGTWSLVGTLLDHSQNDAAAAEENFTNLGALGGRICFHKNVNGMWLIKQCIDAWTAAGREWSLPELIAAAEKTPCPQAMLDVDDPDLLLAGQMPQRINAQRLRNGLEALDEGPEGAPAFACLIFHSLATRYAKVLDRVAFHSGKKLKRLFIVGGASQNDFLNRLTQKATKLELFRGSAESSTIGNFAVQLAMLEGGGDAVAGVSVEQVSRWAKLFVARPYLSEK
jgi:rhamnulokinase